MGRALRLLLLAAMFLTPLIYLVPFEAVAPALVVVGFMMISQVTKIDWNDWGLALPAFLTVVVMPFTYSISVGIGAGFIPAIVDREVIDGVGLDARIGGVDRRALAVDSIHSVPPEGRTWVFDNRRVSATTARAPSR